MIFIIVIEVIALFLSIIRYVYKGLISSPIKQGSYESRDTGGVLQQPRDR